LIGDSKIFWAIPKPARIPPQTPPAGGKSVEAGQIQNPRKIVCPAESALFPFHSLGFSAKWVLTFLNKHHHEVNATRDFMASHMANRNVSHMVSQKTSTVVEVFLYG